MGCLRDWFSRSWMLNVFNFRYSLSNNPECPAYDRAYSEAGRVFQDLLCWIIDQEAFTYWEIQSSSYGYQFQSLNIHNYCPKNNFVFKSSFLFFLLPSFCPSVLGQRRYNGLFVSCGWQSARASSRAQPQCQLLAQQRRAGLAQPSIQDLFPILWVVLSWPARSVVSVVAGATSFNGPAQEQNNLAWKPLFLECFLWCPCVSTRQSSFCG